MERKWYHFFVAIKRAYVLLYVFLFVVSLWSTNYSGRFQRYSIGKMSSDLFVKKWYELGANDSSLNHYICGDKRVTLLSKPSLDNYASNATKKKVYSFSVYLKDEHCIANFNCFIGSTPLIINLTDYAKIQVGQLKHKDLYDPLWSGLKCDRRVEKSFEKNVLARMGAYQKHDCISLLQAFGDSVVGDIQLILALNILLVAILLAGYYWKRQRLFEVK